MPRLFGTDGIRGVANVEVTSRLAHDLARAVATGQMGGAGELIVGQDTRRSGDMLVAAIVAGATASGVDVHALGVCPTPALAHVARKGPFSAGLMVSASHNPAHDNGLKVLDSDGLKLSADQEDRLELLMAGADGLPRPRNDGVGRSVDGREWLDQYLADRIELAHRCRSTARVVLDCANGSGGITAPRILSATGADVAVYFNEPDGTNINRDCGATAPEALAAIVEESDVDVGFCLDGDGDRCVAVDENGHVVDGDRLIGLVARDRLARGALTASTVVVSILSNGGLVAAIESAGGNVLRTPVGDRQIHDAMAASGAGLGGEKSGHLIVMEHGHTGDGSVTALEVLAVMSRTGRRLSELGAEIQLYPQQQRTIPARLRESWQADVQLADAVRTAEAQLAGRGRVVVRPSGTEPALRIMVEGEDETRVAALIDGLSALASERLN